MDGIRSIRGDLLGNAGQASAETDASGPNGLPAATIPIALALHRATYAGQTEITLNDLASATGIPILDVCATVGRLETARLVRIVPWRQPWFAPVDWMKAPLSEQLQILGKTAVEMTAFLPSLLEGQLDYSPAGDEAQVAAIVDTIEPEDFPHPDELVARINLPARRAREALARHMRGPLEAGMRLRITFDVSFPEMTTDNLQALVRRLTDVIAHNTAVRCEDIRFRSSEAIAHTQ